MLCIGGGVLLATVFIHMIPEVREQLELAKKQGKKGVSTKKCKIQRRVPPTGDISNPTFHEFAGYLSGEDDHDHGDHQHEHDDHSYPIAELVICAGFFIIYLIEALVHKIFGLDHGHSHGMSPQKSRNDVENGGEKNSVFPTL